MGGYWEGVDAAERKPVVVGEAGNLKTLRQTHGGEANARAAAESEWKRIRRGAAAFSLTVARGRPDSYPETPVQVRGFKQEIDQRSWLVTQVKHSLGESGYTTAIECETAM